MAAARPSDSPTLAQPKTYQIGLRAIASLPARLCNPPPSDGQVRSFGLTPLLDVRLEDVLNRKHLPPLGLKDFEEWLLFVEMSPENLYFVLWLKEYKLRYNQWKSQTAFEQNHIQGYPVHWTPQHSSHLSMFYARAKQTFLTPNADYELNVPSSLLAPFHRPNNSPHPDPDMFSEIAIEANRMLNESLKRFVHAQLTNVGNKRVMCGIVAGTILLLLGMVPSVAVNFALGHSRWLRITAFPGIWLGLTIIFAALNGLCIGVYIFGDLRQLRKFELSRPVISNPQPLPAFKGWPKNGADPVDQGRKTSVQNGFASSVGTLTRVGSSSASSHHSVHSEFETTDSSDCGIQISPAYYDADHMDGPIICTDDESEVRPNHNGDPRESTSSPDSTAFTTTASFIHPFDMIDDEREFDRALELPERNQRVAPFRFDSLPKRYNQRKSSYADAKSFSLPQSGFRDPSTPHILAIPAPTTPKSWIGRLQNRCLRSNYTPHHFTLETRTPTPTNGSGIGPYDYDISTTPPITPISPATLVGPYYDHYRKTSGSSDHVDPEMHRSRIMAESVKSDKERNVRRRFKLMKAVPAFAVPLTRILSPVVVRGQWEIVVRSALLSMLVTLVVITALVALPVPRR